MGGVILADSLQARAASTVLSLRWRTTLTAARMNKILSWTAHCRRTLNLSLPFIFDDGPAGHDPERHGADDHDRHEQHEQRVRKVLRKQVECRRRLHARVEVVQPMRKDVRGGLQHRWRSHDACRCHRQAVLCLLHTPIMCQMHSGWQRPWEEVQHGHLDETGSSLLLPFEGNGH